MQSKIDGIEKEIDTRTANLEVQKVKITIDKDDLENEKGINDKS